MAYFRYFLGYLQLCLTRFIEAKVAKADLIVDSISDISTKSIFEGIFIKSAFVRSVFAQSTFVSAGLSNISYCLSIKQDFIDILLNFIKLYSSLIITNLSYILKRL